MNDVHAAAATHDDIVRLCPGIQDHTAVEILHTGASVREFEAAMQLLHCADEGLMDIRRREGDRIDRLLYILARSEIRPQDDSD